MDSAVCDNIFKILSIGESGVGKTCILLRYVEDTFTENHISTIGVDFKTKLLPYGDNQINKLQIWDTAGQDRFRCITKNYFRGSNGIMLIYDITSTQSFQNIKNWVVQIKDYLGDEASIILVGNKIDLESNRRVSWEDGMKLAKENKFGFYEASAKENRNIDEAFEALTEDMIKKTIVTRQGRGKSLTEGKNPNKKKCCKSG